MSDLPQYDMVVELDMLLSSAEIQETWDEGRKQRGLPKVKFTAEGYRVAIRIYPDNGSLPAIQEIKRCFTAAMHRKGAFPSCRIHWLT
jgi:hypothetical protein